MTLFIKFFPLLRIILNEFVVRLDEVDVHLVGSPVLERTHLTQD